MIVIVREGVSMTVEAVQARLWVPYGLPRLVR